MGGRTLIVKMENLIVLVDNKNANTRNKLDEETKNRQTKWHSNEEKYTLHKHLSNNSMHCDD